MKTSKVFKLLMAMMLSVTLYSCGGENTTDVEETVSDSLGNGNTVIYGNPIVDGNLSDIENFQNNITYGNFKAPNWINSKFDYVMNTGSSYNYDYDNNYSFNYSFCFFVCTSNNNNNYQNSGMNIMTRSLQTNGSVIRQSEDSGFSSDPSTLRGELAALIQRARNRSNSVNHYFYQIKQHAFIFKPGPDGNGDNDFEYIIDLDKPLVANPVYKRDLKTGAVYDFVTEYSL